MTRCRKLATLSHATGNAETKERKKKTVSESYTQKNEAMQINKSSERRADLSGRRNDEWF